MKPSIIRLRALEKQLFAYRYALNTVDFDAETVAPEGSADGRAEACEVLSRASFELLVNADTAALLQQGSGVCVDKQLKAGAAQHLAGLGAAVGAALGGNSLGIEINGVERVAVGKKLLFQRTQADDGRLHVGDLVS